MATNFQTQNGGENAVQFGNGAGFSATGQPVATSIITPESLAPTTPTLVPQPTYDTAHADALATTGSVTSKSLQDYIGQLTPTPTAADQKYQATTNSIADLTALDTGREQAQIDAESASGATQAAKDLTALNNRLTLANATYEKQFANLGGNGGVEASGVLAAQQAGLRRAQAADIGLITAQIQAKQGDLSLALETANRAVDAKYTTIEDQIKVKQAQLEAIQPILNKEEKVQAIAQQQKLQDQAQQIADEKASRKENLALVLQSGLNNKYINNNGTIIRAADGHAFSNADEFLKDAGVSSFDNARALGLIGEINPQVLQEKAQVNTLASKYPDAGITSKDTLDSATAKLQNSRIYRKDTYIAPNAYTNPLAAFQAIDVSTIKDKNASQPQFGGLSYNGLYNATKTYLATGKMPSLGLGQAGDVKAARNSIVNYAGQLADQMGVSQDQVMALYKANSKAASDIINRVARIDATSGALTSQFPRLAELAGKVGTLGIKEQDLTAGKATIQRKFGSVDAANYVELLQTVRGDYSAMQAAFGGGRGGEFFARNAQEAIPIGLTPEQYLGIQQTIQQSAQNALDATNTEAQKLIGASPSAPSSSSSQPPAFTLPDGTIVHLQPDGTYK